MATLIESTARPGSRQRQAGGWSAGRPCKFAMLPVITLFVLVTAAPPHPSFLPSDVTPAVAIDPGMQMLAELVTSVTEFRPGDCSTLLKNLFATRTLTLPAARTWLRVYASRPEEERLPWRQQAAVMLLALGRSQEQDIAEFLKEALEWDALQDYATFPDFMGMETGARLREYLAFAYLALDPIQARKLALEFIKEDTFASRICALILDQCWDRKASVALLDLLKKTSWTTTISTTLQVIRKHDPSMYITALEVLRNELVGPQPFFKDYSEQFRYHVRRRRIIRALAICREEAMVKTLVQLLDPKDQGRHAVRVRASGEVAREGPYQRSLTEESILAIQTILGRDFGYADDQSPEERRATIERCKRYVRRHL